MMKHPQTPAEGSVHRAWGIPRALLRRVSAAALTNDSCPRRRSCAHKHTRVTKKEIRYTRSRPQVDLTDTWELKDAVSTTGQDQPAGERDRVRALGYDRLVRCVGRRVAARVATLSRSRVHVL